MGGLPLCLLLLVGCLVLWGLVMLLALAWRRAGAELYGWMVARAAVGGVRQADADRRAVATAAWVAVAAVLIAVVVWLGA